MPATDHRDRSSHEARVPGGPRGQEVPAHHSNKQHAGSSQHAPRLGLPEESVRSFLDGVALLLVEQILNAQNPLGVEDVSPSESRSLRSL